jgi:capsule polysaccharide export protein KpsE/RkpR
LKKLIFALLVLAFTGINAEQPKTCVFKISVDIRIIYSDTKEDTGISGSTSKEYPDVPDISAEVEAMKKKLTEDLIKINASLKSSRKVEIAAGSPVRLETKCTEVKEKSDGN